MPSVKKNKKSSASVKKTAISQEEKQMITLNKRFIPFIVSLFCGIVLFIISFIFKLNKYFGLSWLKPVCWGVTLLGLIAIITFGVLYFITFYRLNKKNTQKK